jgi:hypothetical protein
MFLFLLHLLIVDDSSLVDNIFLVKNVHEVYTKLICCTKKYFIFVNETLVACNNV